jgi:hypothetical protein
MVFTDWMGLAKKENCELSQTKSTEQSVDVGMVVSGNSSAVTKKADRVVNQKQGSSKMLLVQAGEYCPQIADYALKIAKRLGCGIIALDVSDKPLQFSGKKKIRESDNFIEKARKNGEKFIEQAETRDIPVTHVMDIGNIDEIIARILRHDDSIRYMLNQPPPATSQNERNPDRAPVVSLHCLYP